MSFTEAFNGAETKVTEVPVGDTQYIIKNYNFSEEKGVGLLLEFPKYRLKEWANYSPKGAGILKRDLKTIGSLIEKEVSPGKMAADLEASLKKSLGRTGVLNKSFSEARNGGKPFANYNFKTGEAGDQVSTQRAQDDDEAGLPF